MVSASILLAVHVAIGWTGVAVGLAALLSRIPIRPFIYLLPWHKWLGRLFVLLMYFMPGPPCAAPLDSPSHAYSSSIGKTYVNLLNVVFNSNIELDLAA